MRRIQYNTTHLREAIEGTRAARRELHTNCGKPVSLADCSLTFRVGNVTHGGRYPRAYEVPTTASVSLTARGADYDPASRYHERVVRLQLPAGVDYMPVVEALEAAGWWFNDTPADGAE